MSTDNCQRLFAEIARIDVEIRNAEMLLQESLPINDHQRIAELLGRLELQRDQSLETIGTPAVTRWFRRDSQRSLSASV